MGHVRITCIFMYTEPNEPENNLSTRWQHEVPFFFFFAGKILWCDSSNATKPSQSPIFRAFFCIYEIEFGTLLYTTLHRIHKWRTSGKKLVPSHESEALEDKQKFQMKTFSELPECLARIPPKITLYGLLFKYSYVGCLLLLMLEPTPISRAGSAHIFFSS